MKFMIGLATLITCCFAAPNTLGPINPCVFGEAKPEETVTLINDAKEVAKYRRETRHPFYPTLLPDDQRHYVAKRDHNTDDKHQTLPAVTKPKPISFPDTITSHKPQILPATTVTKPLITTTVSSEQHKRDIPVPLVAKKKHPELFGSEEEIKGEGSNQEKDRNKEHNLPTNVNENYHKIDNIQVEDLSVTKPLSEQASTSQKQLHKVHLEGSHTENKRTDSEDHKATSESTDHPVIRPKPVPVAELFARHHGDN